MFHLLSPKQETKNVQFGRLKGLILRSQLILLLKHKVRSLSLHSVAIFKARCTKKHCHILRPHSNYSNSVKIDHRDVTKVPFHSELNSTQFPYFVGCKPGRLPTQPKNDKGVDK